MKKLLFIMLLSAAGKTYCQDSLFNFSIDSVRYHIRLNVAQFLTFQPSFNHIYQSPDKKDKKIIKKYSYLINQQPNTRNYNAYYNLACSLWETNKLNEAAQLFLNIVNSPLPQYEATQYHSSDVPGDTTSNIYGYGSYTSSYKNGAAIGLTKIYILQQQYAQALTYLQLATKKYKVTYNCGTGFHAQKEAYDYLYARCYEGLKEYGHVMELLLPECLKRNDDIIIHAIKETWSPEEIKDSLIKAENSIECSFDSLPSYSYESRYNKKNKIEKTDTISYYSGSATINLFNTIVEIPTPYLLNNERITRERFIAVFKESSLYSQLAAIAGIKPPDDDQDSGNE